MSEYQIAMEELEGEFVIKVNGELIRHTKARDLPASFDHLIKFKPKAPEPPHTEEDHNAMSKYTDYLQELMLSETK